jgi:AGZA family xanthine/uracil permease-like MFS transporter
LNDKSATIAGLFSARKLREQGTSLKTEFIAGATTFMTAAYLIILIPTILASGGMDRGAVTTATTIMFVIATLGMALYAKLPFVAGPGIGSAAMVATTLALGEGVGWQTGMGIAFWSGFLFVILTVLKMREVVTRVVPAPVKMALSASIGGFIALLGFRNAGLVIANPRTNALALGNFAAPGAIVALIGFGLAVALHYRKIRGGIIVAILVSTILGLHYGVTKMPASLIGWPHRIAATLMQIDFRNSLRPVFFPYLFAFFAAEFFSTMGTTLAVGDKAGLVDAHGNMERINGPFVVDSVAATIGPLLGVPSTTALIESAAGVEEGGRTGLTAIVAAALFFLTLFLAPILLIIPPEATAPALMLVGLSMFSNVRRINLANFDEALPGLLTILMTLFANNFGTGIAAGILSYVILQVIGGRARQVSIGLYILTIPLLYFFWSVAVKH